MAKRGTTKDWSEKHENEIADIYMGVRSRSSGAADHDQGDVRTRKELIECKYAGSPTHPLKNKPKIVADMEKIADEAWAESKEPMLCLRWYDPASPLANTDGWIDVSVRLLIDDVLRSERLGEIPDCPEDGVRWR